MDGRDKLANNDWYVFKTYFSSIASAGVPVPLMGEQSVTKLFKGVVRQWGECAVLGSDGIRIVEKLKGVRATVQ